MQQKSSELTASEEDKDQVQGSMMGEMFKKVTLVEQGKEQHENEGKKEVEMGEEEEMEVVEEVKMGEEEEVEVVEEVEVGKEEEEIRMRRHSPRMTLPMQGMKENKKRQVNAGEEVRRISPRLQGGGGEVSKEVKMYLFGLA